MALARRKPQKLKTKPLEVLIVAAPLGQSVGMLASMMLQVVGQPIADMPVDLPIRLARIAVGEVVRPSLQMSIEPCNQARDRSATLTPIRQFVDLIPFLLQRLLRRLHVEVSPTAIQIAV